LGEVSGDQYHIYANHTWRVSPDGALRDTFGNLRRVFMMPEEEFFERYSDENCHHTEYLEACQAEIKALYDSIPELPFGNIWIAKELSKKLPTNSELHVGILNSLRSWNFFNLPAGVESHCNVGGFGIDGGLSTLIGASFIHPEKIHFGVFGDLAFFYDMNVLGNRHVGNNVRILLINNGMGAEFRNYGHPCCFLGEDANDYVAAAGHFGNKSFDLVKHYATDLGYEYLSASDQETFLANVDRFLTPEITDKPMIFEIFTAPEDESTALETLLNLVKAPISKEERVKNVVRSILGPTGVKVAKKILGK
jgi:2-succinyl-5-enolpyruvyl-6-hydroxy-3-cyclohexene-1-carboxylate synthase